MDPPFFHSAMGHKNLKKFRHIQFSTPDSPVFAEFNATLTKKKFLQKFARPSLNTNP
jgi:hypothetical protein